MKACIFGLTISLVVAVWMMGALKAEKQKLQIENAKYHAYMRTIEIEVSNCGVAGMIHIGASSEAQTPQQTVENLKQIISEYKPILK